MKTIFSILSIFLASNLMLAQCPVSFYDLNTLIDVGTEIVMDEWGEQKAYETSEMYQRRLRGQWKPQELITRDSIKNALKASFVNSLPTQMNFDILGGYDLGREAFKVDIECLGIFYVSVPEEQAKAFESDDEKYLKHKDFAIYDNEWELMIAEIYSPKLKNGYFYKSEKYIQTSPQKEVGQLRNLQLMTQVQTDKLPELVVMETPDHPMPDGHYDIHENLPETLNQSDDGIAVLIGNNEYEKAGDVNFAIQDVKVMRKYLIEVLGYQDENILVFNDLKKSDFEEVFGSYDNHRGKLFNKAQRGESDIFIFYSGHGAPGLNNQKAYFLPVDCAPSQAEFSGYSLNLFLENLSKVPANSKTVVIDACFSGIDLIEGISAAPPVKIRQRATNFDDGKTLVMTSSEAKEVSTWYYGKEHGLFTYFFLKAIHDHSNSDIDGNDQLTYRELFEYVSDLKNGVPYCAGLLVNGVLQHPVVVMGENLLDEEFVRYK